jgi:hypothetical protein
MDEKVTKMQNLVTTYSQSIEYYQSINSELYLDLNLRMQQLLTKPQILELLDYQTEKNQDIIASQKKSKTSVNMLACLIPDVVTKEILSPDSKSTNKQNGRVDQRIILPQNNRNEVSPDTQDSAHGFDTFLEENFGAGEEDSQQKPNGNQLKVQADGGKDDFKEADSNEFVYHRNDKRNRHGVSFKVCKNRQDGALLRPQLPPKFDDKDEIDGINNSVMVIRYYIHKKMLNENNNLMKSTPRVVASQEILNDFQSGEEQSNNMRVIEKDMYSQESALKIRLLKRENLLNKRRRGLDTSKLSDSSTGLGSPIKQKSGPLSFGA